MADDPDRNGGDRSENYAPDGAPGRAPADAASSAPGEERAARQLRGRLNLRGHIVVDDDEPLPVFDAPADPPPAPPAAPGGRAAQG